MKKPPNGRLLLTGVLAAPSVGDSKPGINRFLSKDNLQLHP